MTTRTQVHAAHVQLTAQAHRNLGAAYLALEQAERTLARVRAQYEAAEREVGT